MAEVVSDSGLRPCRLHKAVHPEAQSNYEAPRPSLQACDGLESSVGLCHHLDFGA